MKDFILVDCNFMAFDKSGYIKAIEHSPDNSSEIEKSVLNAFKIDDYDGIAKAIGFSDNMINKVDYFVVHNLDVQLIELSDLDNDARNCLTYIEEETNKIIEVEKRKIRKREEKEIRQRVWKPIKDEFVHKWYGSIAVIERLYRKTNELGEYDPNYSLLIVCKNKTDTRILDELKNQLSGKIANIEICNTKMLDQVLIAVDLS
ncbi:MAG: hypothetical protein NTW85_05395 [Methylococcales bacterium]|nr:hypothetical protein [Methylococcales bacterium]